MAEPLIDPLVREDEASALRELFGRQDLSQAVFGKKHEIGGQSMVSQYLSGHRPLNLKAATAFARGLGVPLSAFSPRLAKLAQEGSLLATNVDPAPEFKALQRVPIVGEVKGGDDGFLEELAYPVGHGDGYLEYPSSDAQAYALRVRGDSMHPRFRAGEFVVVEPSIQAQEGDDVIVICKDGRKLLKQLNWMRDGEVQLLSINNGYSPLTLLLSEVATIHLVAGRVRRNAFRK